MAFHADSLWLGAARSLSGSVRGGDAKNIDLVAARGERLCLAQD